MFSSGLALAGANTWLKGGPLPPEAENAISMLAYTVWDYRSQFWMLELQ